MQEHVHAGRTLMHMEQKLVKKKKQVKPCFIGRMDVCEPLLKGQQYLLKDTIALR